MSTSELNELKKCVGGLIAMRSFVSTTKNPIVAEMFAGNGEERPNIESVIFEIIIDESDQIYERSPFADISAFSSKEGEEEVLLCLGTMLRVESVETKEQVTWVRVHMCQRVQNELPRQIIKQYDNMRFGDSVFNEIPSLCQLTIILTLMGDYQKFKQVINSAWPPIMNAFMSPLMAFITGFPSMFAEFQESDTDDPDYLQRTHISADKQHKLIGPLRDLLSSYEFLHVHLTPIFTLVDNILQAFRSDPASLDLSKIATDFAKAAEEFSFMGIKIPWELTLKVKLEPLIERLKLTNESVQLETLKTLEAYHDETCSEKVPERIERCYHLATTAYDKGDYDEAAKFVRDGLEVPSNKTDHPRLYNLLIRIYLNQENWFDMVDCSQAIISMPQLPANSPYIVEAYMDCAWACKKLEDYPAALLNYTKSLELQHQHHPSRHPFTAKVYISLGTLFDLLREAVTAIDHFQSAIALGFPESESEAHYWIARTYQWMRKYDESRSHLLQSLEIRQLHLSSKTYELLKTCLFLAEIEHITGRHQQRDLYMQQASCFSECSEQERHFFPERFNGYSKYMLLLLLSSDNTFCFS
jgi:hypothetical protein